EGVERGGEGVELAGLVLDVLPGDVVPGHQRAVEVEDDEVAADELLGADAALELGGGLAEVLGGHDDVVEELFRPGLVLDLEADDGVGDADQVRPVGEGLEGEVGLQLAAVAFAGLAGDLSHDGAVLDAGADRLGQLEEADPGGVAVAEDLVRDGVAEGVEDGAFLLVLPDLAEVGDGAVLGVLVLALELGAGVLDGGQVPELLESLALDAGVVLLAEAEDAAVEGGVGGHLAERVVELVEVAGAGVAGGDQRPEQGGGQEGSQSVEHTVSPLPGAGSAAG